MKRTLLLVLILFSIAFVNANTLHNELSSLSKINAGALGLAAYDTGSKTWLTYNANQRFPFCSTFKLMLAAAILKRSETDKGLLHKHIHYIRQSLIGYSPLTRKNLTHGMTVQQLCRATVILSDNAAANLLMKILGGPKAVTHFARSIGDKKFNLVRWETTLNSAIPGDIRDTTTPLAMTRSLYTLLFTDKVLNQTHRHLLQHWLLTSQTGAQRIHAGAPNAWRVGDKTGTGAYGTTNDIGVIWPPHCKPIVISVYFTQHEKNAKPNERIIANSVSYAIKQLAFHHHCLTDRKFR